MKFKINDIIINKMAIDDSELFEEGEILIAIIIGIKDGKIRI